MWNFFDKRGIFGSMWNFKLDMELRSLNVKFFGKWLDVDFWVKEECWFKCDLFL